ncbi:MAG TPA: tryptophan 7-halogenase [Cellvibrio sp.]
MNNFGKISIVGNGLSAWMICAFMAKQLQNTDTKITLYTGVDAENTTDLQSPLPLINEFFNAINISPEAINGAGGVHPKLGTAYLFDNKKPFFHVWGKYGAPIGAVEFHQILMRSMQSGSTVDLNKLSISSASVLAGRFQKPTQDFNSIYSTYESSYSFETECFVQLLKSMSKNLGVDINEEKIFKLKFDDNDCSVFGMSNTYYECDYLINTVPALINGSQRAESWFASLPFDLKSQTENENSLSALVDKVKVLDESSWLHEVSHRNAAVRRVYQFSGHDPGNVYIYEKPRAPRYLGFGAAMASMHSPLFSAIDLNLIAIKLLLRYFPSPSDGYSVANEFNKVLKESFENLRDITQLCLNVFFEKSGRKNQKIILSDQAKYIKNLFKCRGRYPLLENEFFKTEWKLWLLIGLGCDIKNIEPMASFINDEIVKDHISKVERSILKALPSIPLVN